MGTAGMMVWMHTKEKSVPRQLNVYRLS